jgi:hypothetical protein
MRCFRRRQQTPAIETENESRSNRHCDSKAPTSKSLSWNITASCAGSMQWQVCVIFAHNCVSCSSAATYLKVHNEACREVLNNGEAHSQSWSQRTLARVRRGGGVVVEMSTNASVQGVSRQKSSSIRPSMTGLEFADRATYERGYDALNEQSGAAEAADAQAMTKTTRAYRPDMPRNQHSLSNKTACVAPPTAFCSARQAAGDRPSALARGVKSFYNTFSV